jgi:hypothetical protein
LDVYREIQSLLASGLRFTIEINGQSVIVKVGDYLRHDMTETTVATLEEAVRWLGEVVATGMVPVERAFGRAALPLLKSVQTQG